MIGGVWSDLTESGLARRHPVAPRWIALEPAVFGSQIHLPASYWWFPMGGRLELR